MSDISSRREPQHDSDYDGAWKEALRDHFEEFVAKYFPSEHAAIDWTQPPEWCYKELSQILGQSGHRNREVDVLVKVRLLTGSEQWVLLHLEIQTRHEEGFAERLARYNAGVHWIFQRRAVTLAVLADLRRGWRPDEDVFQVGGFETRIRFPICKLIERLEAEWQDDNSLPVLLARAQVESLRTAGDAEARYRAKWLLVRGLYDLGYNARQAREIVRLVDWMMHLRVDLEARFQQELNDFEQELNMPYVTSFERLAAANIVLSQLAILCGPLPEDVANRVGELRADQLFQLSKALLRFQSLADLRNWLEQPADSNT